MIYGETKLMVEYGSVVITKRKSQQTRHYLGTNQSRHIPQGQMATVITANILARNDNERILIEQLLHGDEEANLYYQSFFYKRVVPDAEYSVEPADYLKAKWKISASFIAHDPVPYSQTTEEVLY